MSELCIYLIKANIALTLFYLAYRFGLRRLTFYHLNRFFLLFGIAFSVIFPFINVDDIFKHHTELGGSVTYYSPDWYALQHLLQPDSFTVWTFIQYAFWAGVIVMGIRFLIQLTSLLRIHLRTTNGLVRRQKVKIMQDRLNPFSFFNNIYINPSLHTENELESIITHERIHAEGWHTTDIILGELNNIFYWFNPGAWLMKTAIRENLEFITDHKILQSGIDAKTYQYSLIQVSRIPFAVPLVNNFNFSHLKQRISMMNKKKSSHIQIWRYLLLLPLIAGIILIVTASRGEGIAAQSNMAPKAITAKILQLLPADEHTRTASFTTDTVPVTAPVSKVIFTPPSRSKDSIIYFQESRNYAQMAYQAAKEKNYNKALSLSNKALQENPGDSEAKAVINYVNHLRNYEQKLMAYNENKDVTTVSKGNNYANLAYQATKAKNYDKALNLSNQALHEDPDNAEAKAVTNYIKHANAYQRSISDYNGKHYRLAKDTTIPHKSQILFTPPKVIKDTDTKATIPLIIINGKQEDNESLQQLPAAKIESVSVLKGKQATTLYGKKGENGVILIKTKADNSIVVVGMKAPQKVIMKGTIIPSQTAVQKKDDAIQVIGMKSPGKIEVRGDSSKRHVIGIAIHNDGGMGKLPDNALYFINDKAASQSKVKLINANDIGSISILKDSAAKAIYGPKGENGVIKIYLKDFMKENPKQFKTNHTSKP